MPMTSINEKMGLKPAGTRSSTKSKRLVTALRCPECGCRHVLASAIEQNVVWCGACSHRWTAPDDVELPAIRGADRRQGGERRRREDEAPTLFEPSDPD